jgi:hypothetical protein
LAYPQAGRETDRFSRDEFTTRTGLPENFDEAKIKKAGQERDEESGNRFSARHPASRTIDQGGAR